MFYLEISLVGPTEFIRHLPLYPMVIGNDFARGPTSAGLRGFPAQPAEAISSGCVKSSPGVFLRPVWLWPPEKSAPRNRSLFNFSVWCLKTTLRPQATR